MAARRDPIMLYRFAMRAGDRRLAELLVQALRGNRMLRRRLDRELCALPRAPAAGAGAGQVVLRELGDRLGLPT